MILKLLNDMQDISKNIEEYNLGKKRKVLIAFDDMIAGMINHKKLNPIVTEHFNCLYYTNFLHTFLL